MFGSHFYHATVRKSVAVFGTMFNNIMVARKKGDGSLINQQKVPLAYGPKQKFLSRLDSETGQDASVAMKLPRMSFEISSIEQDTNKKLGKRISIDEPTSTTTVTAASITREEVGDFTGLTGISRTMSSSGVKSVTTSTINLTETVPGGLNINNVITLRIQGPTSLFTDQTILGSDVATGSSAITASQPTYTEPYVVDLFIADLGVFDGNQLAFANPSDYAYQIGGLDLKISDALFVNPDHVFWASDYHYQWQLTQAQMDILFDSVGTSAAPTAGNSTYAGTLTQSWNKFTSTPTTSITGRKSIKQQSPYNINMQLNIMAKNQDDGLQILEQIIPYFQPEYTVAIKPIDDMTSFKQDVPIILNSVSFDDQYEGDYNSRRVLIYTLEFTMKMTFYGPLSTPGLIRQVLIDFTGERKFGAAITLLAAVNYPTSFVPGATIYQGSDKSRTWSGTIESLETKLIRLAENNTTGYTPSGDLFVNKDGVIQKIEAPSSSIALSTDLNTISSIDIGIGASDTESNYTVTTTIDNTDFS